MKKILFCALISMYACLGYFSASAQSERPNVVFILADDLGYADVGVYGQQLIQTPHIDQLGKEGTIFTDFYAGAPVCSPSRSVLLTGLNTGHTTIRGNATIQGGKVGKKGKSTVHRANLSEQDFTIGDLMRQSGYTTALMGKWHLDGYDTLATPLQRGFDEFSGWLISYPETYASTYWPEKRYRNGKLIDIPQNKGGKKGYYETSLCTDEALDFLSRQKGSKKPFFLMVDYNNPHSPLDAPNVDGYQDKDWSQDSKTYAAMVSVLDQSVEKIKQYLIQSGLDKNTIVIFCSDNGPRSEPTPQLSAVADFFDSNGQLTGYKRDVYEGGIRVPFIAWSPRYVKPGELNHVPGYFADIMPTLGDIASSKVAYKTDGTSLYPQIKGKQDAESRFLYWEFFEKGFEQAVRYGNWKAVKRKGKIELYDLSKDISEKKDLATEHPELIQQVEEYLKTCRTESPFWPTSGQ